MKIFLTSSLGYFKKDENGKRLPDKLYWYNGFLDMLQSNWKNSAKVLLIAGDPVDFDKNDSICECFKKSFDLSGLSIANMAICDERNLSSVDVISEVDVIILAGGHVPTQNEFFHKIGLKEKINNFGGIVIALSAGSMNCADTVYAAPELDGEALDSNFKRWIPGLGLTSVNIFPHYQNLRDEWLDGLRVMEDITYKDSLEHEIIAMNDGTFIYSDNGKEVLFGEAYRIFNGNMEMICHNGKSVELM